MHHKLIPAMEFYRPSSTVIDEFRKKYSNLEAISPEYIRKKSFDAYAIAVWMHNIEGNERLNRIKQPHIENQKRLENKLNQLYTNLSNKQKELQIIGQKIKTLKKNLDQTI
jgi:hypothetical protein